jgi:TonB family protein
MFKFYFASFIACFLCLNSFAQKKQNVYFLKDDGKYVDKKDSADFIRVVREPDSGSVLFNVSEYYPNGNPKLIGKSSTVDPIQLEGSMISYYPNKRKKRVANFEGGMMHGFLFDYFPNGKIYRSLDYVNIKGGAFISYPSGSSGYLLWNATVKLVQDSTGVETVTNGTGHYQVFDDNLQTLLEEGNVKNGKRDSVWTGYEDGKVSFKEEYAEGKFVKGLRPDKAGNTISYMVKEALPSFEGGEQAFGKFLAQNIRYPANAKYSNTQGKVILNFVIEKDGSITNIKTLQSVSPDLAAEGIRVLRKSPKWNPGTQNGFPVRVAYTMPINFTIGR